MKQLCRFCGLVHEPCDVQFCYCGNEPYAVRGEGYDKDCTAFWGEGT